MLLPLLFDNTIKPKSLVQHLVFKNSMLYRLRYRVFWNQGISSCDLIFRLLRQSMVLWWAIISLRSCEYPIYNAINCWRLDGANFQDGVKMILRTVLAEKATSRLYMNNCNKETIGLPWYNTNIRCRSIDTHSCMVARSVRLLALPWKVANTWLMNVCNQLPFRYLEMQSQQSLTLYWRWFWNGAMIKSLSLLPINTAITFIISNRYQATLQLPDLKD